MTTSIILIVAALVNVPPFWVLLKSMQCKTC